MSEGEFKRLVSDLERLLPRYRVARLALLVRGSRGWKTFWARGSDWDLDPSSPRGRLIAAVEKRQESILVMDSCQDERLAEVPRQSLPFRSALYCPVFSQRTLVALVVAEEVQRTRYFTFQDLEACSGLSLRGPKSSSKGFRVRLPMLLGCLLMVALSGLSLRNFVALIRKAPPAKLPRQGDSQENSPEMVAQRFLTSLQDHPDSAYRLLSKDSRRRLSQQQFELRLQQWLSQKGRRGSLKQRRVLLIKQQGEHAEVRVVPVGQSKVEEVWTWKLQRESQGWTLLNPTS